MLLDSLESKRGLRSVGGAPAVPAALTDTGRERELNEDRFAVVECDVGTVWIVCDGMGGATGGELAAQLAIDALRRDLEAFPGRSPEAALRGAILEANRVIVLRRQNQAFKAMGTTIVAVLFAGEEVLLAHVGDSRAYLQRGGVIQQLTTDHTYVQELVERGQIRPEEALSHPQAHVLTRAIGSEPGLEVVMQRYWLWEAAAGEATDTLLLCSDGLYSMVKDKEILETVQELPPQQACSSLVELANSRGGFDNVTVIILPLAGQLRNEPTAGFERRRERQLQKSMRRPPEDLDLGALLRFVGFVVVLSVLAALLVVFLMAHRLGSA